MPSIKVNNCNFEYELAGKGRDIVFIHGEIHGMQYWEHQIKEFSRDFRCLTYNRRGHKGTEWTDYGFSLVNQAKDLEALIKELGIERPVIVALAFGTTVAVQYAIDNPDKVAGMVLGAWSELHDAPRYMEVWRAASERVAPVLEHEGREAMIDLLRREGGHNIYRVIPKQEGPFREKVIQMMASHPLEHYKRGMLEFGHSVPNLVPRFSQLDIPVLGLCGADDPYLDCPETLANMKNFKEAPSIPGAARYVNWQKPDEFNAAVRPFIEGCA
ncbi:alpha/beta fold hydrolase [Pusillimonas noertemannii]|uniref:Pimeloyl-ACP methyl ester carboxylesterase n=1 Tax=Pusillimonas noertemannii TaxID=305977 RepID=A0A2U1CKY6_9BURK|nr:alpha/beta hydrolase [Pusillimonas noertemannii]NYT69207.1 alpha/beta hydrolase [Pusillimonas noertemannii]PVY61676.1 pimeloyl-ACP methyl ester carboxylesterase [Pusillimonas noertemannii]